MDGTKNCFWRYLENWETYTLELVRTVVFMPFFAMDLMIGRLVGTYPSAIKTPLLVRS